MNAGRAWILVVAAGAVATVGLLATATAGGGGSAAAGSGGTVEPVFQNGTQVGRDGVPELAFAIDRVYEHAQPAATPPYHAAGGTWTYFDAHVASDPAATFTVGVPALDGGGPEGMSFAKAMLAPTTAAAGTRVVQDFARAFSVPVPASAPAGRLGPMRVEMAVLGTGIADEGNGYGGSGTWTATKWFFTTDDADDLEVFFNFSLADKRGVWSEKDADYDPGVARALAIALRDGQPLPRTPASDPTLAARPAQLVLGPRIPGHRVEVVGSTADHAIVEIEDADHAALAQLDLATGVVNEIYRTRHALDLGVCARAAARCVVREVRPRIPHEHTGSDPSSLLLVDGASVKPLGIPTTAFGSLALSDDGRLLITGDRGLVAWDLARGRRIAALHDPVAGKDGSTEIIGWRSRAAIVAYEPFAEGARTTYSLWHTDTGKREPIDVPDEAHDPVSPDGSRRVDFAGGQAIVTPKPGGTPRTLVLYARDYNALAGGTTHWLDARTIVIPGGRYWGFLDTDAMKVSLLPDPPPDQEVPHLEVLRGSGHVIVTTADGTFLATVKP